jgi:hypothetical protein
MTIQTALDRKDLISPDTFPKDLKVTWLSELDAQLFIELIQTHENQENISFEIYDPSETDKNLLVPFPYDKLYIPYLIAKCAEAYGETEEYNNATASYLAALREFKAYWNKKYMPLSSERVRRHAGGVVFVYPNDSALDEV